MTEEQQTAIAADLWLLARLHGREVDSDEQAYLTGKSFSEHFSCEEIMQREQVKELSQTLDEKVRVNSERLQSDYAALYLNFMAKVSPQLSFYADKEHLLRQQVTFELSNIYAQEQYALEQDSLLTEDHIAVLLSFLAVLFHEHSQKINGDFLKPFIENYIVSWLPIFVEGCDHSKHYKDSFYRWLFVFTESYLQELQEL